QKMDDWNRKISNSHPFGVLLDGLTKVLPPLDETTTKANDAAGAAFRRGDHRRKAGLKLTGLGQAAIDMSDDVRFAAEVVADATAKALSFSEAMDLVRQGQGTMTGQVSAPGNVLVGKPQSEWIKTAREMGGQVRFDDYGNPYVYMEGVNAPGHTTRNEGAGRFWAGANTGGFGFADIW